jgi:hypothetical protein
VSHGVDVIRCQPAEVCSRGLHRLAYEFGMCGQVPQIPIGHHVWQNGATLPPGHQSDTHAEPGRQLCLGETQSTSKGGDILARQLSEFLAREIVGGPQDVVDLTSCEELLPAGAASVVSKAIDSTTPRSRTGERTASRYRLTRARSVLCNDAP